MGKKRKKASYVEYDYESLYQESLEKIEEENERRALLEGRAKSIYATKEIRSGDQLELEIYPEFTRKQVRELNREQQEKQKKAQKNLNERKSRKMCERLILENFGNGDIWATLTYSPGMEPETMEQALKNVQNFIRRLNRRRKKLGLKNARYIYVTECGSKGRWHHHLITDGDISRDELEAIWKKGRRNQVRRLQKDENGLVGAARYITKEKERKSKHQKTWNSSNGLRKPQEKKNHYKTKQQHVDRMVAGDLSVCDHLTRWYGDKYEYAESEIRYNKYNRRYYIYGRMRQKRQKNVKER